MPIYAIRQCRDFLVRLFLQIRNSSRRASIFEAMMDSSTTVNDFPAARCFSRDLDATRNFSTVCVGAIISPMLMKPPGYLFPPVFPTHVGPVQLLWLFPFAHFLERLSTTRTSGGGIARVCSCFLESSNGVLEWFRGTLWEAWAGRYG